MRSLPPPTPGVSPWNDFWGTSGEIPRWPCVTTWEHWKLKRSVSAPKWQFSPAGQVPMSDSAPSGAIWAQFRPKQLNQKGSPAHTGAHFSSWVGLYYTLRNGPIFNYLGSASDWMKQIFNQSEALPSIISMEFSRSFLRSQFSGKLDFLKVVRLVFWSGVVGPGTNFRSLALRAHSRATRSKARLVSKSTGKPVVASESQAWFFRRGNKPEYKRKKPLRD